jgi:hypothetical protein
VFLSRKTGVDLAVIEQAVTTAARSAPSETVAAPAPVYRPPESGRGRAEQEYLRLMLANDPTLQGAELEAAAFVDSRHRAAFELLSPVLAGLEPDSVPELGSLIGDDSNEVASLLRHLALVDRPLTPGADLARRITIWQLEDRIKALQGELRSVPPGEDRSHVTTELLGLLERKQQLSKDD